jgi:cadmium resistance protein CadD (predicted permease)
MTASRWPRTLALISALGISQAIITGVLVLSLFSRGMQRFDSGAAPTLVDHLLEVTSRVFSFPLFWAAQLLPRQFFPGLLGWVPVVLNGLLWGSFVVFLWRRRRTKMQLSPNKFLERARER